MKYEPISKVSPRYIYFDLVIWNKPESGHIPNMVITQYADGDEIRFTNTQPLADYRKTAEDFGKRLLSEQHKGYTFFAHNFCSYDRHIMLKLMLDDPLKGIKAM